MLRALKRAGELVSGWSDFKIQRTSPYDGRFSSDDDVRTLRDELSTEYGDSLEADAIDKYVMSAFLSAMRSERIGRMRAMRWDPYSRRKRNGTC